MEKNISRLKEFREDRKKQNKRVADLNHLGIKRFFNLDTNTYKVGALDSGTMELLGLVASMVLRCNDCIGYHLEQCAKSGYSKDEILGGCIVIPHFRHAVETIELLERESTL